MLLHKSQLIRDTRELLTASLELLRIKDSHQCGEVTSQTSLDTSQLRHSTSHSRTPSRGTWTPTTRGLSQKCSSSETSPQVEQPEQPCSASCIRSTSQEPDSQSTLERSQETDSSWDSQIVSQKFSKAIWVIKSLAKTSLITNPTWELIT